MAERATVRRVAVPDVDDDALLADVAAYARLDNAVCSADAGHDDLSTMTVAEALGMLRDRDDRRHDLFLAERAGLLVGAVVVSHLVSGAEALEFDLMVDPTETFDVGVADALFDAVLRAAEERGLAVLQTWTLHRATTPRRPVSPSTGVGVVDGDAPLAAFLAARGFALEQVERCSSFDLTSSPERLGALLAESVGAAGPDYRVVSYVGRCPEELVDSFAVAYARMSTDAPQGGTVVEVERPDAARMRLREQRLVAQGLTASVALVVHAPTGVVAAYNELVIGEDRTGTTHQHGTLVVREHRGRRLGMLVKCAGLLRMRELAPASPRVATFNAEENAHMLAINIALGFVPVSYAGAWKRMLTDASGSAGRSGSSGS